MPSFIEGFAQQKGQTLEKGRERQLVEDFRKSQKKLLDAQVDAAQNKLDAQRLLGERAAGRELPTTVTGEQAIGPPEQVEPQSLVDLLTSPEQAGLALQAGVPVGAIAELQKNKQMQQLMQQFMGGGQIPGAAPGAIPGLEPSPGAEPLRPDVGVTMGPGGVQLQMRPPSLTTQTVQTPEGPRIKTFAQTAQGVREVADLGPAKITAAEEAVEIGQRGALEVLDQLENLSENIHIEESFLGRLGGAAKAKYQQITQEDPDVSLFEDLKAATLGPMIRSMGEKGALAEGDVERAIKLLPKTFPVPDSKEVATKKFRQIRDILKAARLKPSLKGPGKPREGLPEGIPTGSRQIGTSGGKPVFEDPAGKRWIAD